MSYVTTGLSGNGRTRYFNFQYDDALSNARGLDLAADMMNYCDDDLSVLSGWFSGRQLDTSPPIHVSISTVATDAAGDPTQSLGGGWSGVGAVPLQVTISMGEFSLDSGTPTMLARTWLAAEVSEMYMRALNAHGTNPWFRSFNEGNKGEALSRFLSVQLLRKAYPGATSIPLLIAPSGLVAETNVTFRWLQGVRTNYLEVNDDDIQPNEKIGCGTLFLHYLHDQLGYRIEEIISAGASTLANVYENLTGDSWRNAWTKFSGLVNLHYPPTVGPNGMFQPLYDPPLDTAFPVSNLARFSATPQLSWPPTPTGIITASVDNPPKERLPIMITSSHPSIIPAPSMPIFIQPSGRATAMLTVLPQPTGFTQTLVTLSASYAGRTLTDNVRVVSPQPAGLPALLIDVDRSADLCQPLFIEGTSETFQITNLSVFASQAGLSFYWSVTGAPPGGVTNAPNLTIATLPAAGTMVTIRVHVTNAQGLNAEGELSFQTALLDFRRQATMLRCRLSRFRNLTISIPEWTAVEQPASLLKQLNALERQIRSVSSAAASVTEAIKSMKKMSAKANAPSEL